MCTVAFNKNSQATRVKTLHSGSYMFIHTKDVISTDDYLESLGSDEMTAYGIVYFDF